MENYFNYFTEIEDHFQRRRGGILLLSTLDWALIETWKDAGVPLQAALRGINDAFDAYDKRPTKSTKVNSLAYCAQSVLAAVEEMKSATVGVVEEDKPKRAPGFELAQVIAFLESNADRIEAAKLPGDLGGSVQISGKATVHTLREIAADLRGRSSLPNLEDLERRLTVAEEKLFAALLAATPDERLIAVRTEADRELAPYRRKMTAPQIDQLQKQFVHKRLLENFKLPRLSLFYM